MFSPTEKGQIDVFLIYYTSNTTMALMAGYKNKSASTVNYIALMPEYVKTSSSPANANRIWRILMNVGDKLGYLIFSHSQYNAKYQPYVVLCLKWVIHSIIRQLNGHLHWFKK